jgi:hypothetical protein
MATCSSFAPANQYCGNCKLCLPNLIPLAGGGFIGGLARASIALLVLFLSSKSALVFNA